MSIVTSGDYRKLKEDNPWMYEVGATTLQNTVGHLDKAFQRFFRHQGGFPKFKSKYDSEQSFEVPESVKIDFRHRKIQIPKFIKTRKLDNRLKFVLTRRVKTGKYGRATVTRNAAGQYHISFIVHTAETIPEFNKTLTIGNSLGIDFGLKHFLNLSTGEKIDSPEYFKNALEKLRKEQRKLSRKQKGSRNREKQRLKVARIHQKIKDQREDFLHQLSARLVKESQFDAFCVEDLNLGGMRRRWGRKVSDLSYGRFKTMLGYKCEKAGKKLLEIGRFEPSSQICSSCGARRKLGLDERTYTCPHCGHTMDRDTNAAINIRNFALRDVIKNSESTDGTSGTNACGVGGSGRRGRTFSGETADGEAGKFPRL